MGNPLYLLIIGVIVIVLIIVIPIILLKNLIGELILLLRIKWTNHKYAQFVDFPDNPIIGEVYFHTSTETCWTYTKQKYWKFLGKL